MDSINRNQTGDHRQDLRGTDAIARIKELAGKAHTCFFCTEVLSPGSSGARPMSVQEVTTPETSGSSAPTTATRMTNSRTAPLCNSTSKAPPTPTS